MTGSATRLLRHEGRQGSIRSVIRQESCVNVS
ncbi:hypothetical protein EDD94_4094 [Streptomyces sp. PanSC9]|nr:hypothetical protein EDD94_4094 [Streptomyces sp. PanSC9]